MKLLIVFVLGVLGLRYRHVLMIAAARLLIVLASAAAVDATVVWLWDHADRAGWTGAAAAACAEALERATDRRARAYATI